MSNYTYFGKNEYHIDDALKAAIDIQRLEEDKKIQALRKLAEPATDLQLFILCRMLFKAKMGNDFRMPMIGINKCIGNTEPSDWPLAPIELVDDVPFFIVTSFSLKGKAEKPVDYLDYCLEKCTWNNQHYRLTDSQQKQKALEKIKGDRAFLQSQL